MSSVSRGERERKERRERRKRKERRERRERRDRRQRRKKEDRRRKKGGEKAQEREGKERSISTIHIGTNIRHHYWIYSTAVCLCACIHTQQHKHVSYNTKGCMHHVFVDTVKLTQEHFVWPGW